MVIIDTERNIYILKLVRVYSRRLFNAMAIPYGILILGISATWGLNSPTLGWLFATLFIMASLISWQWISWNHSVLTKQLLVRYPYSDHKRAGWAEKDLAVMDRILPWTTISVIIIGIVNFFALPDTVWLPLLICLPALANCYMFLRRRFILRLTHVFLSQGSDYGEKYRGSRFN